MRGVAGVVDSGARTISNDVKYLIWKMIKLKRPTLLVVLSVKRMQMSVVKSPLRTVVFNSRPFLAGRLVDRGLLGVLALSEVSDGGDEKASCKVRIPLLPSDRDIGFSRVKDGEDESGAGTGLLLGVGGLQCRPRVDESEAEVSDGVEDGEDENGG